jgi:hypothetical protein
MRGDLRERRRTARRSPDAREPLSRMRLRAGRELTVVDVSASGALVEGPTRLLPGTHVDVHVVTRQGRVLVRSRIVRAYVCGVRADAVCYRGALAFERLVDTAAAGYAIPDVLLDAVGVSGPAYPHSPRRDDRALETASFA